MALTASKFITAQNRETGLAGVLQNFIRAYGTATVVSGQTEIAVADTDIKAGDLIIASVQTKGTNAAYVVGVTISAGVSFTLAVNTDPGTGGAVIGFMVLRAF